MNRTVKALVAIALLITMAPVNAGENSLWHVTIGTNRLGPVELHMELDRFPGGLNGESLSGAESILKTLPGAEDIDRALFAFEASLQADASYRGTVVAPWKNGEIEIRIAGDRLEGSIDSGMLAGEITGIRVDDVVRLRDYPSVVAAFDIVVASKLFSPADLQRPAYLMFRDRLGEIAAAATNDLDLLFGFHWAWRNEPFSHFEFKRSTQTSAQLFEYFDSYRVGFEAATVEFRDDIAILKVRTMMGADTIEQIEVAYESIAAEQPTALVVDLRGNSGGAFAVKPLVEHVIDEPVDAGYFLSQVWNREHDRLPTTDEILASPPWDGWSIISFWHSVQESDILRLQFRPETPNYDGDVYVLLDSTSASATELAADAFRSSGITTIVGQTTAGQMLSQSMFDVADGFIVSLPVADYYSIAHGRIEGAGVPVDVVTAPGEELDVALQLADAKRH